MWRETDHHWVCLVLRIYNQRRSQLRCHKMIGTSYRFGWHHILRWRIWPASYHGVFAALTNATNILTLDAVAFSRGASVVLMIVASCNHLGTTETPTLQRCLACGSRKSMPMFSLRTSCQNIRRAAVFISFALSLPLPPSFHWLFSGHVHVIRGIF